MKREITIAHETQILLTQKITAFFLKYGKRVEEQHKKYNKSKKLKYGKDTLWKIQHGKKVHHTTILDVMEKLGIKYCPVDYEKGVIKHVENEQMQ